MSDLEFDILDQLYFVTPYAKVLEELSIPEQQLKAGLKQLLEKGFVRCFKTVSEEALPHEIDWELHFANYYYLATKEGLLAHNGMG